MPSGTCDPASRGETENQSILEYPLPNGSGSILADVRYGWNGTSQMPNCDGPILSIRTRNTGTQPAWVNLPNKKKGNKWIQVDPGTNVLTSAQGQLSNLGLVNMSDAAGVGIQFTDPALP